MNAALCFLLLMLYLHTGDGMATMISRVISNHRRVSFYEYLLLLLTWPIYYPILLVVGLEKIHREGLPGSAVVEVPATVKLCEKCWHTHAFTIDGKPTKTCHARMVGPDDTITNCPCECDLDTSI